MSDELYKSLVYIVFVVWACIVAWWVTDKVQKKKRYKDEELKKAENEIRFIDDLARAQMSSDAFSASMTRIANSSYEVMNAVGRIRLRIGSFPEEPELIPSAKPEPTNMQRLQGLDEKGIPIEAAPAPPKLPEGPPSPKRLMLRRVLREAPPDQLTSGDMKVGDTFWIKFQSGWEYCKKVNMDGTTFLLHKGFSLKVLPYVEVLLKRPGG